MEDKLTILMTADTVGGVWSYAMTLCRELQRYNTEIHLLTMGAWLNEGQNKEVREFDNVILYESNLKLEWMEDSAKDVAIAAEWIADVYATVKPDVIHFNNYPAVDNIGDCGVITVFHSCVCSWFRAVIGIASPKEWNEYRSLVEESVFSSDVVVFPSFAMLGQAKEEYGPMPHAQIIYNGINQADNPPVEKQPFILTAGRLWDEAKNLQLLSRIAKDLEWPVQVAGNNTSPDAKCTHADNNIFLGSLKHEALLQKMQEASIFVSGAFYEPFGLAVLEAAASGCALVLSSISSFREIWGDAAVYFDPNSEEDAKVCIQQLIENDAFRREMGERAKQHAQQYSSVKMAESYMSIYEALIHKEHQPTKTIQL